MVEALEPRQLLAVTVPLNGEGAVSGFVSGYVDEVGSFDMPLSGTVSLAGSVSYETCESDGNGYLEFQGISDPDGAVSFSFTGSATVDAERDTDNNNTFLFVDGTFDGTGEWWPFGGEYQGNMHGSTSPPVNLFFGAWYASYNDSVSSVSGHVTNYPPKSDGIRLLPPDPDIRAAGLEMNDEGDLIYAYQITGLPSYRCSVASLWWSSSENFSDRIGPAISSKVVESVPGDHGPVTVPAEDIRDAPENASHILFVVDENNNITEPNEANNVVSLPLFDLVANDVSVVPGRSLSFSFSLAGGELAEETSINLYWSEDAFLDDQDSYALAQPISVPAGTQVGEHVANVGIASLIDPPEGTMHLVVVVDAAETLLESNEGNNAIAYRPKIGIVTHGQVPSAFFGRSEMPAWVTTMAHSLCGVTGVGDKLPVPKNSWACNQGMQGDLGYDAVMAFDWAEETGRAVEGVALQMGGLAADKTDALVVSYLGRSNFPVDIHLIGHSRGTVVMSEAARILNSNHPVTRNGSVKLSLLDPHPARNTESNRYSATPNALGWLAELVLKIFQGFTKDPDPVIPNDVASAVYYQETPTSNIDWGVNPLESILNLWGIPIGTNSVVLTGQNMGHAEVVDYYQCQVIPFITGASCQPALASVLLSATESPSAVKTLTDFDLLYPRLVSDQELAASISAQLTLARTAFEAGQLATTASMFRSLQATVEASDSVSAEGTSFFSSNLRFSSTVLNEQASDSIEAFYASGTLYVIGDEQRNKIRATISRRSNLISFKINGGALEVTGEQPYMGQVQRLVIEGRGGNDHINLSRLYGIDELIIRGGEGNDRIIGSRGNDIILGGPDRDSVRGGLGDDILIGGFGKDRLAGTNGNDLIIAGTTTFDNNNEALFAIQKEWTNPDHDYADRVANLRGNDTQPTFENRRNQGNFLKHGTSDTTVFSDDKRDALFGGSDDDWYFYRPDEDHIFGRRRREAVN